MHYLIFSVVTLQNGWSDFEFYINIFEKLSVTYHIHDAFLCKLW